MPNIMKRRAVVVQRDENAEAPVPVLPASRIIKRRLLENPPPAISTDYRALAPQEAYVEELNRLKAEIEQAKTELRHVRYAAGSRDDFLAGEYGAEDEAGDEEDEADWEEMEFPGPAESSERSQAMQQEALELVNAAEQDARQILAHAERDAQAIREQAKNEGYLEGFDKGYNEAVSEFRRVNEPKAGVLADLVENLSEFEQDRLRRSEQELVELTLGVAAKIVGDELRADPKLVVSMLSDIVTQNYSEEYVRITLAEDLLPVDVKVSVQIKKMLTELGANVTVLTEPRSPAGTLLVETPKGIIDMSVDTQLKNIRSILEGAEQ